MPSSISLQFHKDVPDPRRGSVLPALAAALCSAGCIAMLIPAFPHIPGFWPAYALFSGLLSAVLYLLIRRFGRIIIIVVSIFSLILFLICISLLQNGILVLANDLLAFITGRTGRIHMYYPVASDNGVFPVVILYLILISLLSAVLIRKRLTAWPVILTVFSAVAFFTGFPASPFSILLLTAAVHVFLAARQQQAASLRIRGRSALSVLVPASLILTAITVIFGLFTLMAGNTVFPTERIVRRIQRSIHERRYEPAGSTGMPEGDLLQYAPLADAGMPMLQLSMDHPEKLYLRGYTGEVYEESAWKKADDSTYINGAPLFSTLHKQGFYGQTLIANAAAATQTAPEAVSLRITPADACREYLYTPYALADTSVLDPLQIGDAGVIAGYSRKDSANESESITVSYLPGSLPTWYTAELALADAESADTAVDYLRLEQAYSDYVNAHDRQLSEEAASVCAELFGTEAAERHLADILNLVREKLGDGYAYDPYTDPVLYAGDEDVVKAFADIRRGGSVHFATSAVLMLRYLGVPARYVEGYLLTAEEAAAYPAGEDITLTTAHAHAWAEFYLRGIGWVPFETTPGYIDQNEISQVTAMAENARTSAGESPLYAQTEVVYVSGLHGSANSSENARKPLFFWRNEYLLFILIGIIVFLVVLILAGLASRRHAFQKTMDTIRKAKDNGDYATAISLEYAYASMLMREASISDAPGLTQMKSLNDEARFSTHTFTDEQVDMAADFTDIVVASCLSSWSWWKRWYNHWIRWII